MTSAPGYVKKGLDQGITVDDIDALVNEIQRNIQTVRTQTNFLIGTKSKADVINLKLIILVTVERSLRSTTKRGAVSPQPIPPSPIKENLRRIANKGVYPMKTKGSKCLTWVQRLQIEGMVKAKVSKKKMAEVLGVSLQTVYNELKRGTYTRLNGTTYEFYKTYSPDIAQRKYEYNLTSKGPDLKITCDYALIEYIEERVLNEGISPCAVLGDIKKKNLPYTRISKTTLYRYIRMGLFPRLTMQHVKKYEKRYQSVKAKRAPRGTSIELRPEYINDRQEFGHWEMDCVCGKGRSVILVLTERKTRREILHPMESQSSRNVVRFLNKLEKKYGKNFKKIFKSITVDNGSEFSDCKGMEKSIFNGKRTKMYYCHPYSSWERGSNERMNREIRRLIPKGTNIGKISPNEIRHVQDWVNSYPREIFGYATSEELFQYELLQVA